MKQHPKTGTNFAPKRTSRAPNRRVSSQNVSKSNKKGRASAPQRSPEPAKTDLKALQTEWYNRLAREGFKDIELHGGPGIEPSRNYLNCMSLHAIAQSFDPVRQRHFERCRNFLTHCPAWAGERASFWRDAALAYTEGRPYHTVARKYGTVKSEVYKATQAFVAIMTLWNAIDPEGLDYPSDF